MLALRIRYDLVRSLWKREVRSAAVEQAFDAWCALRFDAYASMVAAVVLLSSLLVSFVDRGVPGMPWLTGAFVSMRIAGALTALVYFIAPRPAFVRRHLILFYALTHGIGLFFVVRPFAAIAGPEQPYVHFFLIAFSMTIALPMRLVARALLNLWWGVCSCAAVFVGHADYAATPWAQQFVFNMGSAAMISIAFGQLVQMLYRQTYFQMQEIGRHREVLLDTVAERTREVRALAAHMDATQEAERTRIARDLHDDVGQEVVALRYALALARKRFVDEPTAIGANLAELEALLSRTTASMQGVLAELRPRILDDLGLAAAARWLASRVAERSALTCEVAVAGDDAALDAAHRTAAFRILQEALTNVVKHAAATRADVTLTIDPASLELVVADDGKGLPDAPTAASPDRPAAGMGVLGMRERAIALGGTLTVTSRAARGVEVRCRFPLVR